MNYGNTTISDLRPTPPPEPTVNISFAEKLHSAMRIADDTERREYIAGTIGGRYKREVNGRRQRGRTTLGIVYNDYVINNFEKYPEE